MAIGIVASQLAMINPYDTLGTEHLLQVFLNLLLSHRLIAMGGHQAACRRKDGAASVALNRAALEHEVQLADIFPTNHAIVIQPTIDGIVKLRRELITPAVEPEVEQSHSPTLVRQGDETMIAGPSVVRGTLIVHRRMPTIVSINRQYRLVTLNCFHHLTIGSRNLIKHRSPVCLRMGPRQLHATLWFPFGR